MLVGAFSLRDCTTSPINRFAALIYIICIDGAAAAVKMMVRAFREDPAEAREKEKDLILDDHTQCGCSCGEESGHGDTVTC